MSAPQKFMFDNSFDKTHEVIDPIQELKAKFEEKIATSKSEAFEEGKKAGHKEALETIEEKTQQALNNLAAKEQELRTSLDQSLKQIEAKSVEFGITAGTKLAAELIRREPMPLVESFFKEAFQTIIDVPEIVASIHPSLLDQVITKSEAWKLEASYKGNISFIKSKNSNAADVSITWKDGGIKRSVDDLINAINSAMSNYFSAQNSIDQVPDQPAIDDKQSEHPS